MSDDAALAALGRYRAAADPLPVEPGLYQGTLRLPSGLRHMARLGIDLDGQWFEYRNCRVRRIESSEIVVGTVRVVDWTKSPEVRLSCVQQARVVV